MAEQVPDKNAQGQSDRKIRSILERGPAVMYHCQEYWDYGIDYISPNITDLTGWAPEDFIDNSVFRMEIIHPDDQQYVLSDIQSLFDHGHQIHEYRLRKKDGEYIWVMDDVRTLQSSDGSFDGLVGYLSDITEYKATERSLRESELRHRAIFETVLEGIITIDSKGIVKDMNNAAENMFGYQALHVIGRNIKMLMPEPFASKHDDYLAKYHQTAEANIIGTGRVVRGRRSDGETFEMSLSVSELNLPDGKYFVGAVRDISKRVRAENALKRSQERLRMSQQFAKIGTWDWHIEEDKLFWSDQVFPLLGIINDGVEERTQRFRDWVHPEDCDYVYQAFIKCFKKGEHFDCEHRVLWPDGTVRWVHEQGDVVRNTEGRAVRMVGVIHDVSEKKRREKELERARHAADDANQAKSEFLSRMSHELRTPLNAILGFAQLLGMSGKNPLVERQKSQVGQIVAAGNHLMDLINEVLDLARIEAGRLNLSLEPVDMASLMEECFDISESLAKDKDIDLHLNGALDISLWVDRTRLKQILLNILSNAIKYNELGGFVKFEAHQVDEHWVEFRVSDDGPGIRAEQKDQIFMPFNRLGAENSQIEGTGIGLTLTKQLVEAMGGTIGFDSIVDEGSTFWVRMPIATETEKVAVEADVKQSELNEVRKVLFVDDNNENRDVMTQFASMVNNLDMVVTNTGKSGLEIARDTAPDLIVLDINIDDMDGIELCKAIRQLPNMNSTPIFALSADKSQATIGRAMAAGFDEYLFKPIDLREFRKKLTQLWATTHD
ncbi:putative Histidine kinase [Candidatus Terasakiella magnetica]|uniref:Sensor protein FixL n=1 Tax=Candidatus Terasakiella magnetica TaxID=1867952 RepID=A0A1C3RIW3_9PROT|nr:PAS domain S-box protein [Candidatus Terasakiella magnetica]SCA57197.1 putative Histidine kinase [Candidatus Terasakiella magnetica]